MQKNKTILILILFLITIGIYSCVNKRNLNNNTLVIHMTAEPDGLHPTNDNSVYRANVFELLHRYLFRTNFNTLQTEADLVDTMPVISANGTQFTYTLKNGTTWDDGSPLTVEDIIFSTKISKCPLTNNPQSRPAFESISDVVKDPTNAQKFTVITKEVYFENPTLIGGVPLLQQKHWDPKGVMKAFQISDFNSKTFEANKHKDLVKFMEMYNSADNGKIPEKITGLGAYQIVKWNTGQSLVLVKKKNWWGSKLKDDMYNNAYADTILFKVIQDQEPVKLALKKEEIDYTYDISTPLSLIKLQELDYFNKNYKSGFIQGYSYNYLGMNMRPDNKEHKAFFTDKKVRRAMAHLLPIEEMFTVLYKNKAMRQTSCTSPLKACYNDSLKSIPFNPQKASQLLAEAGWKDTDNDGLLDKVINGAKVQFSFQFSYMTGNPIAKEIALMLKDEMEKVGVEMLPNPMDFSLFYKNAYNHNFDMMMGGWGGQAGSEDYRGLWHQEAWATKGSNFTGFGSAETDVIIEKMNKELDPIKRNQMCKDFQKIIYDEQPYVFVAARMERVALHKRFAADKFFKQRPYIHYASLKLAPAFTK